MQATSTLRTTFEGTAVPLRTPSRQNAGTRQALSVQAYKKGSSKVKGGYGGSEPNAKKGFTKKDASGRPSKGYGAYRFTSKYGDINDYSPIYDPYTWAAGGDTYSLGTSGLAAWAGFLALGLAVSVYLVVSTSQI